MFERLNDRLLCESLWGAAGEGSALDEMYLCFLELHFCSSWRTSQYDSNLLGLDFLLCLNLVVSTMNNRTQFQWWFLRGGIPKIKLCNCPLQKYSNSLSIWYEFDRFPLRPVFPYPTFSLLFRQMQTVFSLRQPLRLRFSSSLVFVPVKACLRLCLWHIFRNSLCKRRWPSPTLFFLSSFLTAL